MFPIGDLYSEARHNDDDDNFDNEEPIEKVEPMPKVLEGAAEVASTIGLVAVGFGYLLAKASFKGATAGAKAFIDALKEE
jgi:hypothetical protein